MNSGENNARIAAVVLAAGQSKRMGSPKLVLPWGQDTVIGKVVRTLQEAGLDDIVVVTGSANSLIENALHNFNVQTIHNQDFVDGEMLASCKVGFEALDAQVEAALVVLGDQPQIEAGVVKSILRLYANSKPVLVVPSYQMHRGHPWLVARKLWPAVLALQPNESLRDFLAQQAAQITYLPVESSSILQDLDTPADYDRYSRSD
jgi:molybdenum cofactor cytidylyltransferase